MKHLIYLVIALFVVGCKHAPNVIAARDCGYQFPDSHYSFEKNGYGEYRIKGWSYTFTTEYMIAEPKDFGSPSRPDLRMFIGFYNDETSGWATSKDTCVLKALFKKNYEDITQREEETSRRVNKDAFHPVK